MRRNPEVRHLVEQTEAHILVGLLLLCSGGTVRTSWTFRPVTWWWIVDIPSSFSSAFVSAGASVDTAPPAPADGAAAAPPPDPTFNSISLTSLPSSACASVSPCPLPVLPSDLWIILHTLAKSVVHIGSTSSILAALMSVCSLSACTRYALVASFPETAPRSACEFGKTHGDVDAIIGQDESGVGSGELGV